MKPLLQSQLNVDDIIATVEGKSGKSVLETIVEAGNLLESRWVWNIQEKTDTNLDYYLLVNVNL